MKKTIKKIIKKHGHHFAEYDSDLQEDFFGCKCGASLGEYEASEYGYPDIESWHAEHVAKKINKAFRMELISAWREGHYTMDGNNPYTPKFKV